MCVCMCACVHPHVHTHAHTERDCTTHPSRCVGGKWRCKGSRNPYDVEHNEGCASTVGKENKSEWSWHTLEWYRALLMAAGDVLDQANIPKHPTWWTWLYCAHWWEPVLAQTKGKEASGKYSCILIRMAVTLFDTYLNSSTAIESQRTCNNSGNLVCWL